MGTGRLDMISAKAGVDSKRLAQMAKALNADLALRARVAALVSKVLVESYRTASQTIF
jgi:hypothetical protein